jgi:hypothetical protein
MLDKFNDGSGVCIHFNHTDKTCSIYDTRPLICRVDEAYKIMFFHIPLNEYIQENMRMCKKLQEDSIL